MKKERKRVNIWMAKPFLKGKVRVWLEWYSKPFLILWGWLPPKDRCSSTTSEPLRITSWEWLHGRTPLLIIIIFIYFKWLCGSIYIVHFKWSMNSLNSLNCREHWSTWFEYDFFPDIPQDFSHLYMYFVFYSRNNEKCYDENVTFTVWAL